MSSALQLVALPGLPMVRVDDDIAELIAAALARADLALRDGYTSGHGMGLGLGGAKRLVNEFDIESAPGKGTRVTITRWR